MKLKLSVAYILLLLILSTVCAKMTSKQKPTKSQQQSLPMISEGSFVSIKDYPYVVGLVILYQGYTEHICGGTIISKYIVLTAAHCLTPKEIVNAIEAGKVVVRGGGTNIRGGTGYDHRMYGYKIHEDYYPTNYSNDIALIQVKDSLDNAFEQAIDYPEKDEEYPMGDATILGWGRTESSGTNSVKLRAGPVYVADCDLLIWWKYSDWVCADPIIIRRGDNGGPMVQNNSLIGVILSRKVSPYGPVALLSRVAFFSSWIDNSVTNITSID